MGLGSTRNAEGRVPKLSVKGKDERRLGLQGNLGVGRWPASFWPPEPTAEGPQTFNNVQEPNNVQACSPTISGPAKMQENMIDNQEERNQEKLTQANQSTCKRRKLDLFTPRSEEK